MKKIILCSCLISSSIFFASCGGQNPTTNTPSTTSTAAVIPAESAPIVKAGDGAALKKQLQGVWQHSEDTTNYLEFTDASRKEYIGTEKLSDDPYTLQKGCAANESLTQNPEYILSDTMCWHVDAISDTSLTLMYLPRGNTLTYTRSTLPTAAISSPKTIKTLSYHGSMFEVAYPDTFTPVPTEPSEMYEGQRHVQTDEASFISPDEKVAFYVFSPQWSGEPEYLQTDVNEVVVDTKEEKGKDGLGDSVTTMKTLKAKDGSYYRSYVSMRKGINSGSETHTVFGIRYADQQSYNMYKDAYLAFKKSLVQYAD